MNTPKITKFIALYARVSTSAQEVQETIEAQLIQMRAYAEEHGYIVVKEYLDNGWSGDMLARPALDEMRLDAKKKIWDGVLMYDPDRLARRYSYQELVMDELREGGVEVMFVTISAPKDDMEKILHGVKGLFAEYERAKIADRFRIGKVKRIKNGHILVSEAAYGYTYIPNEGKKGTTEYVFGHYVINEEEAKVVRIIFDWVANQCMTLRTVVKKLQELNIKPRRSQKGVWNTSTLRTLVRNPSYIGSAHWGASYAIVPEKPLKDQKYKKIKKTSRRMKPESEWSRITVPTIIDEDTFVRAGKQLEANFATMGRNKKNSYLLAGKIWCTCGRRRAGEGPQHGKHLYYRCTDRVYSFPLPRTCLEGGINARITDDLVWNSIKEIMSAPELMEAQVERWMNERNKNGANKTVLDFEKTEKELAKLKGQEDRYTKAYSESIISLEKLREYLAPVKEKILTHERSLAQASIEKKSQLDIQTPSKGEIKNFASMATQTLNTLNFRLKKAIIDRTVDKITSTQKEVQVHGYIDLHELYVEFKTSYWYCRTSKRGQIHAF